MDSSHALLATQTPTVGRRQSQFPWLTGLLLISVAVHLGAALSIGKVHPNPGAKVQAPTFVTMTVAPAKPSPSDPAAPESARTDTRVARTRSLRRPARPVVGASPVIPRRTVAETPADFTGVTLTNRGPGSSWASATGDGGPMTAPLGTPGLRVTGRSRVGPSSGEGQPAKAGGPAVLALGDLSKPPRAPVLSDLLERNYPEEARRRGVPGKAVMRLRVMPDGHLRDLIVVAESQLGFGEACKRTLRESLWSPPLDLEAHPVSTVVSYTCTFEVH